MTLRACRSAWSSFQLPRYGCRHNEDTIGETVFKAVLRVYCIAYTRPNSKDSPRLSENDRNELAQVKSDCMINSDQK